MTTNELENINKHATAKGMSLTSYTYWAHTVAFTRENPMSEEQKSRLLRVYFAERLYPSQNNPLLGFFRSTMPTIAEELLLREVEAQDFDGPLHDSRYWLQAWKQATKLEHA